MKDFRYYAYVFLLSGLLLLGGCFGNVTRKETKLYVLDYLKATEREELKQINPKPHTLEVWNTTVARAYSRNQIVVKENNFSIRYLPHDVWATRLSDAVPNIIVQRLRAYNIFQKVDRDIGVQNPNYYLETNLLNLERVDGIRPRAYLKMEFYLRESATQRIVLSHKADSYMNLLDDSVVYLVQTFNELIMRETDIFSAKVLSLMEGRDLISEESVISMGPSENFYFQSLELPQDLPETGELLLNLQNEEAPEMYYTVSQVDEEGYVLERFNALFGQAVSLDAGKYTLTVGENQEIDIPVEVLPRMRTVVDNSYWSELRVLVIDEGRNRVRLGYDIFHKEVDGYGYELYGQGYSSDELSGVETDKIWIMPPGEYMLKLGGGSWTDLKDFTTIKMDSGQSKVITIVVDPSGERSFMLGAGELEEQRLGYGKSTFHRGAVHTNISLSQKNSTAQEDPVNSFNLNAQFDNSLSFERQYLDYSLRSLYDLGMNLSTGNDFRISLDGLSLKNTLLFTPIKGNRFWRNFGLYGRTDVNTHLFDEMLYFGSPRNIAMIDRNGDTLSLSEDQTRMRSKIALFPLRLKEGTGITYRFAFGPNISLSVRGGYGWQQELNKRSFTFDRVCNAICDTLDYDIYIENEDNIARGIESTIVLSAINLLKFLSINSTFDVLFPVGGNSDDLRYESDNRVNIRIYRNISIDLKANLIFDKANKDYVLYDYSSFLRLSLFY